MHTVLNCTEWEEEVLRDDGKESTAGDLAGCIHIKDVRKSRDYSAQLRVEERRHHCLIYVSALVIAKRGRTTHDYGLEDLCFFRTREFEFKTEDPENLQLLKEVGEYMNAIRKHIDQTYFPREQKPS